MDASEHNYALGKLKCHLRTKEVPIVSESTSPIFISDGVVKEDSADHSPVMRKKFRKSFDTEDGATSVENDGMELQTANSREVLKSNQDTKEIEADGVSTESLSSVVEANSSTEIRNRADVQTDVKICTARSEDITGSLDGVEEEEDSRHFCPNSKDYPSVEAEEHNYAVGQPRCHLRTKEVPIVRELTSPIFIRYGFVKEDGADDSPVIRKKFRKSFDTEDGATSIEDDGVQPQTANSREVLKPNQDTKELEADGIPTGSLSSVVEANSSTEIRSRADVQTNVKICIARSEEITGSLDDVEEDEDSRHFCPNNKDYPSVEAAESQSIRDFAATEQCQSSVEASVTDDNVSNRETNRDIAGELKVAREMNANDVLSTVSSDDGSLDGDNQSQSSLSSGALFDECREIGRTDILPLSDPKDGSGGTLGKHHELAEARDRKDSGFAETNDSDDRLDEVGQNGEIMEDQFVKPAKEVGATSEEQSSENSAVQPPTTLYTEEVGGITVHYTGNSSLEEDHECFRSGDIVVAKTIAKLMWSGVVISAKFMLAVSGKELTSDEYSWVYSIGEKKCFAVRNTDIFHFEPFYEEMKLTRKSRDSKRDLQMALALCAERKGINENFDSWVEAGLQGTTKAGVYPCFEIHPEILHYIDEAHCDLPYQDRSDSPALFDPTEEKKKQVKPPTAASLVLKKVKFDMTERLEKAKEIFYDQTSIGSFCVSCYDKDVVVEHPFFSCYVCSHCQDELKSTLFATDDNGVYSFCTICACPVKAVTCSGAECMRSYCDACLQIFFRPTKLAEDWLCCLCKSSCLMKHIRPRKDWRIYLAKFYEPERIADTPKSHPPTLGKIRVLSLFDGIGTGLFALQKLGFEVEKYFICETDYDCISLTSLHNLRLGEVTQFVGQVEQLTERKLTTLGRIDLILGGPPCTELSGVNVHRRGLFSNVGLLTFDFFRILRFFQKRQKTHVFWLAENVASMSAKYRNTISDWFNCDPVVVDAGAFTPQKRPRLFWGNIPGLTNRIESQNAPRTSEYLEACSGRICKFDKLRTITTNPNSLLQGLKRVKPVRNTESSEREMLWITEIEQIFGFPKHYTDVANLSFQRRLKLLGKAWSVPVVEHILRPLKSYYLIKSAED